MIVVSYYTDNSDYPEFAKNLKENLDNLNIKHHIPLLENHFNRNKNMSLRWNLLNDCMEKFDEPLLWIDVDSEVLKGDEFKKFYTHCTENYDFVAGDKLNKPNLILDYNWTPDDITHMESLYNDDAYINFWWRWRGTQQFYNNTEVGKQILKYCVELDSNPINDNCHDEQIITASIRRVYEEHRDKLRTGQLPPEFRVSREWMMNENVIKDKLDYDDENAVVRYLVVNAHTYEQYQKEDSERYILWRPDKPINWNEKAVF